MYSAVGAGRPPPGRQSNSGGGRPRRFRAVWIGLRRKARRCWAGLCAVQGGAGPAHVSSGEHAAFWDRHAGRRTNRATGHGDRSNFPRDSLPAPRSRSEEAIPAKEAAAPPQVEPEDSGCVRVIAAANRSGHLTHPIGRQGAWEPFNELRFWQGHDEVSAQARDTWQTSFTGWKHQRSRYFGNARCEGYGKHGESVIPKVPGVQHTDQDPMALLKRRLAISGPDFSPARSDTRRTRITRHRNPRERKRCRPLVQFSSLHQEPCQKGTHSTQRERLPTDGEIPHARPRPLPGQR